MMKEEEKSPLLLLSEKLACLLEERLAQHDNNRKDVQHQLEVAYAKFTKRIGLQEEKLSGEIRSAFDTKEERILSLIERLDDRKEDFNALVEEAEEELSSKQAYQIGYSKRTAGCYLNIYSAKTKNKKRAISGAPNSVEHTIERLKKHLDKIHASMVAAQDRLEEICAEERRKAEETEKEINGRLKRFFTKEDARLQSVLNNLRESIDSGSFREQKTVTLRAKVALIKSQSYSLRNKASNNSRFSCYDLVVTKCCSMKSINFEERKPVIFASSFVGGRGEVSFSYSFFSDEEVKELKPLCLSFRVVVDMWKKAQGEETAKTIANEHVSSLESSGQVCFRGSFTASTTYCFKMRILDHTNSFTQWSEKVEFTTPEFEECCVWKKCPDDANWLREYSVDGGNPRVATKVNSNGFCTIIGNTPIPLNTVTSWSIKILKSKYNNGDHIYIGITPFDINQNDNNYNECGWYFDCFYSTLRSGPPHNYRYKAYGPRKVYGQYVHTGDSVGVVVDTKKGELSFVLNGVNYGVAYEGIPLDEPLVPCVILYWQGDSVELNTPEVKETGVDKNRRKNSQVVYFIIVIFLVILVYTIRHLFFFKKFIDYRIPFLYLN